MRCGIFHWKVGEKKLAINQTQHQLLKTFAQALYEYLLRVPQPGSLPSSSEESDGYVYDDPVFNPLLPPPGFAFDQNPPDPSTLEPKNPQGSTLLGRHILFKWEHDGWCMGVIKSQNKNSRTRVAGQVANFFVLYPMDNSTGTHALPTTALTPEPVPITQ